MPNMQIHADERRIAALLRELVQQGGAPSGEIEGRLGWEPGRLDALLNGRQALSFEVLLEVLPVLDETPGNFFARLYGFRPPSEGEGKGNNGSSNGPKPDRRFEESRRVVKDALRRRSSWKDEQSPTTTC